MGVQGLWQVLEPVGKPVALETLENKVLGVDVSLWMHQAVKGMRDGKGQPVNNAHLMVLLQRVCKLLFYRIKPVFVFDGGVPQLKRQTLAARHQRQTNALEEAQRQRARKALIAHAQRRLQRVQGTPSSPRKTLQRSPKKNPRGGTAASGDIFELPPLPAPMDTLESEEEDEDSPVMNLDIPDTVDIESEDFSVLPADIRHNILASLYERQRYGRFNSNLPKDSEGFSGYQMLRLLKKRNIQQKLDDARRDLSQLRSQQWIAREEQEANVWRIASEANAHQILLRRNLTTNPSQSPSDNQDISVDVLAGTSDSTLPQKSWTLLRQGRSRSGLENYACSQPGTSGGSAATHSKNSPAGEPSDVVDSNCQAALLHECTAASYSESMPIVPEPSLSSLECCSVTEMHRGESPKSSSIHEEESSKAPIYSPVSPGHAIDVVHTFKNILSKTTSESQDKDSGNLQGCETHGACMNKEASPSEHKERADLKATSSGSDRISATPGVIAEHFKDLPKDRCSDDRKVMSTVEQRICFGSKEPVFDNLQGDNQCNNQWNSDEIEILTIDNAKHKEADFVDGEESMQHITSESLPCERTMCKKQSAGASGVATELDHDAGDDLFEDVPSPEPTKEEQQYLAELDQQLAESGRRVEAEAGRLELQAAQLNQQMSNECKELLQLLGMPYLVSPEEAEAQCARLEQLGLTQGTITDDSDVWLFGGNSVYKHFFQREKFVEHFSYSDVLRHFGLDRQKMIAFALLSGSDYTTGVHGVGPVNAMEIISEFQASDALTTLHAFRDWLEKAKLEQVSPGSTTRSHLLRFELAPGFPSSVVVEAYLNPATDSSTEHFTWGIPDLDALRTFGLQKLGWTQEKVDSLLLPVLKRLQEKQSQSRIDSYFSMETTKREQLFPSKRLRRAAKKVAQQSAKRKEITVQEPVLSEESD